MSPAPQTSLLSEDEHTAEVTQQTAIEAEIAAVDAKSKPQEDAPVAEATAVQSLVTLRSKDVEQYPLTVSVVGGFNLVFDSESDTLEVPSEVAEQVTYLQNVEVVI